MDFEKLMRLSEAAMGFSGGPEVDEYPHMGLVECCAAATSCIYESQIEMFESISETNDQALDLTAKMLSEGAIDQSAMEALAEASFKGILEKARTLFNRLIAFFQSMIAKLTTLIDSRIANGKNLVKKYGKAVDGLSDEVKRDAIKGLKGYKFGKSMTGVTGTDLAAITKLITDAFPGVKTPTEMAAASSPEELDRAIEGFDKITSVEAKAKMASQVSGITVSGESWQKDLRKELWGDQVELTYEDCKVGDLKAVLENPADLKAIRKGYEDLKKAAKDYLKSLESDLQKRKDGSDKTDDNKDSTSKIASYYSKYIKVMNDAFACINTVRGVQIDFENAKYNQAKKIFGRLMVKGKVVAEKEKKEDKPKAENNSIEMDEFFLDFED